VGNITRGSVLNICKERDFSLLHHFRHRTKLRSRHLNHAKYTNPFPVFPLPIFQIFSLPVSPNPSKLTQIHALSHSHLTVVLHCYRMILANTCRNTYFSRCNLVPRLYVLRSLPNLHHWKDLFLASLFEYNYDRVWIRGSEDMGCQSPKILTSDLHELRDPPPPV